MREDAFDTLYADDDQWIRDVLYFKSVVLPDRYEKNSSPDAVVTYFGGVSRFEDINVFEFYSKHIPHIPKNLHKQLLQFNGKYFFLW